MGGENHIGWEHSWRRKGFATIPALTDGDAWIVNPLRGFHNGLPHKKAHGEHAKAEDRALLRATQRHRPRLSTRSLISIATYGYGDPRRVGARSAPSRIGRTERASTWTGEAAMGLACGLLDRYDHALLPMASSAPLSAML